MILRWFGDDEIQYGKDIRQISKDFCIGYLDFFIAHTAVA